MNFRWVQAAAAGSAGLVLALVWSAAAGPAAPTFQWKKTCIDRAFVSEGVTVADVNHDGKLDIINGEIWYAAPDWKPHRFRAGKDDYTEGDKNVYSRSFCCWADDLNGDGWPDVIVIDFPGKPCHWYENPRGQPGLWKEHPIWRSSCNETPQYVDLLGDGKRKLVMAIQPEGQMAWFAPGNDPTRPWEMHPISEPGTPGRRVPGTEQFSHGLGVGDLNGDGRLDVFCKGGWWEQPAQAGNQPWPFHPADLGEDCADMHAYDLDGDGKADVLSSSAHGFGIWGHLQRPARDGHPAFARTDLFPRLVSQTHALVCADINGDGLKDLVTGKRWWAHGARGDADPTAPAKLFWFEAAKGADGQVCFTPHEIDADSGIGTQFWVGDINGDGLLDIVVSNKKGTYLFEQVRK
jgi:hypothetical protein